MLSKMTLEALLVKLKSIQNLEFVQHIICYVSYKHIKIFIAYCMVRYTRFSNWVLFWQWEACCQLTSVDIHQQFYLKMLRKWNKRTKSYHQGIEETIQQIQLKSNEKIIWWKVPIDFDLYEPDPFSINFSASRLLSETIVNKDSFHWNSL